MIFGEVVGFAADAKNNNDDVRIKETDWKTKWERSLCLSIQLQLIIGRMVIFRKISHKQTQFLIANLWKWIYIYIYILLCPVHSHCHFIIDFVFKCKCENERFSPMWHHLFHKITIYSSIKSQYYKVNIPTDLTLVFIFLHLIFDFIFIYFFVLGNSISCEH